MTVLYILLSIFSLLPQLNAEGINITINWNKLIGTNKLHTTCQTVVLPPMLRSTKIHDKIYESLKNLNANFTRLLFVSFYPNIANPLLEPPSNEYYCKHLNGDSNNNNWNLTLKCPQSSIINKIYFASFGNPSGYCGNFSIGECYSNNSLLIANQLCLNKNECTIPVNNQTFSLLNINGECNNITYKSFSIQVTCNLNEYKYSNWNFTFTDQIMNDFYTAINANNLPFKSVLDFGVYPNWEYINVAYGDGYPDNPYYSTSTYRTIGTELIDKSGESIGEYYGKLIAYYKNGEFTDIYNQKHINNNTYPIDLIEVLNDPEIEHSLTPETYTILYDSIVNGIWKYVDPNHNQIKFMGLSLTQYTNWNWYTYFLNKSNHISSNIPIDYISFNFFAECSSSNNSDLNCIQNDPDTYNSFFIQADKFIDAVNINITKYRDELSPNTKIDIDEIGIILSDNNNILNIFWNAANAMYSYIYGILCIKQNIDIVAQSFLLGYNDLTHEEFPLSPDGIPGFGASITMLNWTTGQPNAKYFGLKLLIDHLNINDELVDTKIVNNSKIFFAQGYMNKVNKKYKILLINKVNQNITVNINNYNVNIQNIMLYIVDEISGSNPARNISIEPNATFVINPFAVAVAVME